MTRILVCGGRDYKDQRTLIAALDEIHAELNISLIIEGGAKGADTLARTWALIRKVECKTFRADWNHYGKGAGSIRNQQMLDEGKPDLVVPFPGGVGTKNMITKANMMGVPLRWPNLGENRL